MRVYLKKRVLEIDNAVEEVTVSYERDYEPAGAICGSEGATVSVAKQKGEHRLKLALKYNCCTQKVHAYLDNKFRNNKTAKIILQLDNKQEISGKLFIEGWNTGEKYGIRVIEYDALFIDEPKITTPIDWDDVVR